MFWFEKGVRNLRARQVKNKKMKKSEKSVAPRAMAGTKDSEKEEGNVENGPFVSDTDALYNHADRDFDDVSNHTVHNLFFCVPVVFKDRNWTH